MKYAHALASILLLTVVSFAQQPSPNNPQDRAANPTDHTYTRPVETGHNWGGWGGRLGFAGSLRIGWPAQTPAGDDDNHWHGHGHWLYPRRPHLRATTTARWVGPDRLARKGTTRLS
jgi:hypothetical protein